MEKNTAVVLLEKFYRRIFSGKKHTAEVLLEKFYCRIFSGKKTLLKISCWKICLKIFSGKDLLQNLEWKKLLLKISCWKICLQKSKFMNTWKQAIHMLLEHKIDSNKFVSKKPDFFYMKNEKIHCSFFQKRIAVLPNGGLSLLSLLLKKLPSIWPQEPRKIQKTKIHAKLRESKWPNEPPIKQTYKNTSIRNQEDINIFTFALP